MPNDLWYGTSGPHDAEIVIVGEAWGAEEAAAERPFVGSSGIELTRMLAEAGISRDRVLFANVVAARPQSNEMWRLFHPKDVAKEKGYEKIRGLYPTPFVITEVERLYCQINSFPRKVVLAVGNYPLWALTGCSGQEILRSSNNRTIPIDLQTYAPTGIMTWRGSMWHMLEGFRSEKYSETRLIPLIHPAAILRQWSLRAVTVHDLKARVPRALKSDWRRRPAPTFYAPPTFDQAKSRLQYWLRLADAGTTLHITEDIETSSGHITCLGMADSVNFAMCIPFIDRDEKGWISFWPYQQEAELIHLIRKINRHPNIFLSGQNFIYDTQYLQHWMAHTPRLSFDSMLAQNVLFPGTPKSLDYLSSLYCHYYWYWKEDAKDWDLKTDPRSLWTYNCQDVVNTWECVETQRQLIPQMGMDAPWRDKMRINDLCLRMMNRGIRVDTTRRMTVSMELSSVVAGIEKELLHIIPQSLVDPAAKTEWYHSPKQTNWVFYEMLGLHPIRDRKSGRLTTGKDAINELIRKHPEWSGVLGRIARIRSIDNTRNVLAAPLDHDSRMRCSFNPGGTETHRLSSSKNVFGGGTNLQNLTKGEEDD